MDLSESKMQPGYLIRRAHQKATSAFISATRDLGLTAVQYSSLVAIRSFPDIDATRVSELVSLDRTTIGHVLERLEQKEMITRAAGATDKRKKLLRITAAGEEAVRAASGRIEVISGEILSPLTASERTLLLRLLEKIVTAEPSIPA